VQILAVFLSLIGCFYLLSIETKIADKNPAVWRSVNLYASVWQIHDFAPPPHDGFAFS